MVPQKNSIQNWKQTQQGIIKGLEYLQILNANYMNKQQKSFMSTFLHVMDKMSNQLLSAHQHFQNIDKEISADQKCRMLAKELSFFKNQCVELRRQLDLVNQQSKKEKQKRMMLAHSNKYINQALLQKAKAIQKYRSMTPNNPTQSPPSPQPQPCPKFQNITKSTDGRTSALQRTTISTGKPPKSISISLSNQKTGRRYEKQGIKQQRKVVISSIKIVDDSASGLFQDTPVKYQTVELRSNPRVVRRSHVLGRVM